MNSSPDIKDLALKSCCKQALKEIDEVLNLSSKLKSIFAFSPFITVFTPSFGETVLNIRFFDWVTLTEAVGSFDEIPKHEIENIIGWERMKHPGGELRKFWDALNYQLLGYY